MSASCGCLMVDSGCRGDLVPSLDLFSIAVNSHEKVESRRCLIKSDWYKSWRKAIRVYAM
jgi:hypothetical protein